MEKQRFETLCQARREGEELFVENQRLLYKGRVLSCRKDAFVVDAFGHPRRWPRELCEESRSVEPLGPRSNP